MTTLPEHIEINGHTIWFDKEKTREYYNKIPFGCAETCLCKNCLAYLENRDSFFTPEFENYLNIFGIEKNKDIEVFSLKSNHSKYVKTGGWFHLIGTIEPKVNKLDIISNGIFRYYFTTKVDLKSPKLNGQPVLQLEFRYIYQNKVLNI